MDILHDARLLAGASGTDQIVTSVSVMVDPNIVSAVTGGELLVSTAYAIRENIPQLMQLVPQLKEHGVVGLGLKFNSYINEMPQNILDLCNELSFPLFEIPNSISFSQIITPIMTTIVNNQAQTLGDIYELQKALTATMLSGGNLQSIVQTLFDRFGNSVAIYNDFFSSFVLACSEQRRESITRRMDNLVRAGSSGKETVSLMSSRMVELPEKRLPERCSAGDVQGALEQEAAWILEKIPQGAAVIPLCIEGELCSSEKLAERMQNMMLRGVSRLCFILGGSVGLSQETPAGPAPTITTCAILHSPHRNASAL